MSQKKISEELNLLKNPKRAEFSINFFPRGGEMGSRKDLFYGCSVPETRKIAKKYKDLSFVEIQKLLDSDFHEERLCGLMILIFQIEKAFNQNDQEKYREIRFFYTKNLEAVDHWDLVDTSAHKILGEVLVKDAIDFWEKDGQKEFQKLDNFLNTAHGFPTLDFLAHSPNLWHKRVSIIVSFAFLKYGNLKIPLSLCQFHIQNKQHYIQKAVGWVLREIGKKDKKMLDAFLVKNIQNIQKIHSICLSYALEKHTPIEKDQIRNLKK